MGFLSFLRKGPKNVGNIYIGDSVKMCTDANVYANYLEAAENLQNSHRTRWVYKERPHMDHVFKVVDIIKYPMTDDDRFAGRYIIVVEDEETSQIYMTNYYNLKLFNSPNAYCVRLK